MRDDQRIGIATGRSVWATASPSPNSTRRRCPPPLGVDGTDDLDRSHVDGTGTRCARREAGATPSSSSMGGFPWCLPIAWSVNPLRGDTTNRRAGCGRSARPVRREGGPNPIGSPYPYPRRVLKDFSSWPSPPS